jgi:hypothetical protein
MRLIPVVFAVSLLFADDRGVRPRANASDYSANQAVKSATIAAARVPARQIEKMFSPEIARQYVVVEVAIYPQDGKSFDVDYFDFALKLGDTVTHVEKPRDVATPWPEKTVESAKPVTVITETGVAVSRTNDPVYGKRTNVGTYESVGVTNDPRAASPPPKQGPDPQIVEQRVREKSLPTGGTRIAIAGYLFFPQYVKHKKGPMEFQWSKDNESMALSLPEK